MHWLENLIFSCAPLGIITAITSAIRVAGSSHLKAIIGKAREPFAEAEIELMRYGFLISIDINVSANYIM